MTTTTQQDTTEVLEALKTFDGDAASYRQFFESLARVIPFTQPLVISTVPRAGTQILQPAHCPEEILKAYVHDVYAHDRATWHVVLQERAFDGRHIWSDSGLETSPYYLAMMEPNGLASLAAAPLKAPVLQGYPGAIHLYRSAAEGEFRAAEIRILAEVAGLLDDAIERVRESRRRSSHKPAAWEHLRSCRQFVFDGAGRQQRVYRHETPLDERLRTGMRQQIQHRLAALNGQPTTSDRVELVDSNGELWAFRTVVFRQFPALGDGPFIFFCLQPDSGEWNTLRPTDFQADPEVSRLIPTMKFMQQEFQRSPKLEEIAIKAHLSPFHFHRRFTELLGQTPKHFLLGCQIHLAKTMLMERKKPLAQIAAHCGFAHQSHFTSRFKQAAGLTPTRWRKFAMALVKSGKSAREMPGCKA